MAFGNFILERVRNPAHDDKAVKKYAPGTRRLSYFRAGGGVGRTGGLWMGDGCGVYGELDLAASACNGVDDCGA